MNIDSGFQVKPDDRWWMFCDKINTKSKQATKKKKERKIERELASEM